MAEAIYATFQDAGDAVRAVGALLDHGLHNENISVVSKQSAQPLQDSSTRVDGFAGSDRNQPHTTVIDHRTGQGDTSELEAKQGMSTTTPVDAAVGAVKGAGIGLGVGLAAGLASIAIPGIGIVVGGGALAAAAAAAAGTTVAGAVAGGVYGYLKDQGVPHEPAVNFEKAYNHGWALVAVHIPPESIDLDTVEAILRKYNAQNIDNYGVPSSVTRAAA